MTVPVAFERFVVIRNFSAQSPTKEREALKRNGSMPSIVQHHSYYIPSNGKYLKQHASKYTKPDPGGGSPTVTSDNNHITTKQPPHFMDRNGILGFSLPLTFTIGPMPIALIIQNPHYLAKVVTACLNHTMLNFGHQLWLSTLFQVQLVFIQQTMSTEPIECSNGSDKLVPTLLSSSHTRGGIVCPHFS